MTLAWGAPLLGALLMGALGSAHCAGMCGPIAITLGRLASTGPPGAPPSAPGAGALWSQGRAAALGRVLAFQVGRIGGYAVLGALAGALGQVFVAGLPTELPVRVPALLSGVFALILGLHLAGWLRSPRALEEVGGRVWSRLQPLTVPLLPPRTGGRALALGLLWGWIPCGLVYSALAWAVATGSAFHGAALMAAFGAGTLPVMGAVAVGGGALARMAGERPVRQLLGATLAGVGVVLLAHAPAWELAAVR